MFLIKYVPPKFSSGNFRQRETDTQARLTHGVVAELVLRGELCPQLPSIAGIVFDEAAYLVGRFRRKPLLFHHLLPDL